MSDPQDSSVRAKARRALLAAVTRASHLRLCVLVDPVITDPLQSFSTRDNAIVLPIRHGDLKAEHRPYLLELGDFGRDEAIEESLRVAVSEVMAAESSASRGRTVCGWILTGNAPLKEFASHLARCASLGVAGRIRLLRYWDPRVMDALEALLTQAQKYSLLGPGTAWYWLKRNGNLQAFSVEQGGVELEPATTEFWLERQQIELLAEIGYVNTALNVLQGMGRDVACLSPHALAQRLLAGARIWRLNSERERVMYAVYSVLAGDRFDHAPEAGAAMLAAQVRGDSVIDALDAFDDAYWQSLNQTTSMTAGV
ncbi:DUF4123 domain-containing protein [Luteimonas lutimaris]|uniref:DUF4123 domain-containing protein n=1 Tax=Luteimonas lutimaris TaxID=698645 RepID=A0ABP7MRL3_9GAMM